MASVDLKDPYFTAPIHDSQQKYYKFEWEQKIYKYLRMSYGCSDAMQIFIKILKPVYAKLRQKRHLSDAVVGDSYLQDDTEIDCVRNVEYLVFTIHQIKSTLMVTQQIENLSLIIDSTKMTVKIYKSKMISNTNRIKTLVAINLPTIRLFVSVISFSERFLLENYNIEP